MVNITNRDIWYTLGLCATFALGYLSISILNQFLVAPLRRRRTLKRRMVQSQKEEKLRAKLFKGEGETRESLILTLLHKVGYGGHIKNLQRELLQADIYMEPGLFLGLVGLMGALGFLLGALRGSLFTSLVLTPGFGFFPFLFLRVRKNHKTAQVEKQMPDVMELLARSLRAGHTLPSAIELAGQETPKPLGTELRMAYEEQRLGISMHEALRHMGDRVSSPDLRYWVTAVLVQTETGGNLAEIMEKIGHLIRDRLRVKGKIRALTAEGRLSALILGILPFVVFLALYIMNRDYIMTLFYEPLGHKLLLAGGIGIALGLITMRKMVQLNF
jgi:tight adherence protein B